MANIQSVIPNVRLLPAVHGLRGLAAASVVLFHLHHLTNLALPHPLAFVGTHFGLGVQLFFVLSAFSLFYSTTASIGRPGWVRDYFLKRLFRIAPLFYAMLAAWCTLFYLRHAPPNLGDVALNLTFAYNFVPGKHESIVAAGWTVGVEMVFYAILPVLFLTISRARHALMFLIFAMLLSTLTRAGLTGAGGILEQYAHFAFMTSLGVFAVGALAFWVYRSLRTTIERRGSDKVRWMRFALPAVCAALLAILVSPLSNVLLSAWRADILLWALLFGCVLVWQALFPWRALASAAMEFLGERSYSIYLLHPLAIFALTPLNRGLYAAASQAIGAWAFIPCAALTLAVVVGCAVLSYRLIEVPGIQAGRAVLRWARAPSAPQAVTPAL